MGAPGEAGFLGIPGSGAVQDPGAESLTKAIPRPTTRSNADATWVWQNLPQTGKQLRRMLEEQKTAHLIWKTERKF